MKWAEKLAEIQHTQSAYPAKPQLLKSHSSFQTAVTVVVSILIILLYMVLHTVAVSVLLFFLHALVVSGHGGRGRS